MQIRTGIVGATPAVARAVNDVLRLGLVARPGALVAMTIKREPPVPDRAPRAPVAPDRILRFGPIALDADRLRVTVHGEPVVLTGLQLKLLLHFMRHPAGHVFTRDQLRDEVWGPDAIDRDPTVVDVVVCRLKKRLGPAGVLIESVRSFGYRLRDAEDTRDL